MDNKKKTIMIIDDEEDFLTILKLNLEKTGEYDVVPLANAEDIIARLNKYNPDCILLDFIMPNIDGNEVCRILSNDPVFRKIPVIAFSALGRPENTKKAYETGICDYLVKPVEINTVIKSIKRALREGEWS